MNVSFAYAEKASTFTFKVSWGTFDLADLATMIDYSKPLKNQFKQAGMSFEGSDQYFCGIDLNLNVSRKDALIAQIEKYRPNRDKILKGDTYLFMEGETKHLTKITPKYNIVVVDGLFEDVIMWENLMVIDTDNLPSDRQVQKAVLEASNYSDGTDDEYDLLQDVIYYKERGYYCITEYMSPKRNGIYKNGEVILKL